MYPMIQQSLLLPPTLYLHTVLYSLSRVSIRNHLWNLQILSQRNTKTDINKGMPAFHRNARFVLLDVTGLKLSFGSGWSISAVLLFQWNCRRILDFGADACEAKRFEAFLRGHSIWYIAEANNHNET